MKWLILYFMGKRYFRLIDKYHNWQYLYERDHFRMEELAEKIDKLLIRIKLFNPQFPHLLNSEQEDKRSVATKAQ